MVLSFNSMASLYVGDLHPEVDEQMLYGKFSSVGPLISIRICKDIITHRSLGYAYINYRNAVDAERALDTMNFDLVNGKPIRIMFIQRDPSLRKSGIGNIFLKNLDTCIDTKALYDTFSAFGNILSCKIAMDENGISKGYGFIHFDEQKAANHAIAKVNGMLLNGKKIFVGVFIPKNKRNNSSDAIGFNNLYVRNFGDEVSEEEFRNIFESYGTIVSHKIIRDDDGKSKNYGFIAYESSSSAARAVEELHGELYNERRLYVARAQKKSEREAQLKHQFDSLKIERRTRGTNLYVKHLDDTIDDEYFRQIFSPFGTIISGKVMKENGRSRGFGFISYSLPVEATGAIAAMNGKIVNGKPLYVAVAQGKAERLAALKYRPVMSNIQLRLQPTTNQARSLYRVQSIPNINHQRLPMQRTLTNCKIERTVFMLLGVSPEDRKQVLGEELYPKILKINQKLTGKITGMILEMDSLELLELLNNDSMLLEKVKEAEMILKASNYRPDNL